MAIAAQKIMPCLWFDDQAEDAAKFYCSIFKEVAHRDDHPLRQRRTGNSWAA